MPLANYIDQSGRANLNIYFRWQFNEIWKREGPRFLVLRGRRLLIAKTIKNSVDNAIQRSYR